MEKYFTFLSGYLNRAVTVGQVSGISSIRFCTTDRQSKAFGKRHLYLPNSTLIGLLGKPIMLMANAKTESQREANVQGQGHVHRNGPLSEA